MRLERISLLCILSMSVLTGCSANRAARATHDDSRSIPPSHDHEYSPRSYEGEESPSSGETPTEPVPAPPAFGVSNVKSVGWLRDLTKRKNSRSCTSDCAEQEFPVGACTPLESCAPETCSGESACDTPRRERARFPLADGLGRLFKRKKKVASCVEPDCTVPACSDVELPCSDEDVCGLEPSCQAPACNAPVNCGDVCGDVVKPPRKAHRSPDRCLADPLQEADEHVIEHQPAPKNTVPVPEPAPAESTSPVPGVPVIPTVPPSARRVVEPPQWPRRQAPAEVVPVPRAAQADGFDGLPVVMPRTRI